jgi:hypothetical protein
MSIIAVMSIRLVRCLLSKLDAAGNADALEIPLLLSSNTVAADIKLGQRPIVGDVGDISRVSQEGI